MLKIYQIRHPDINASAHSAYMVMAVVIFLGVIGVVCLFNCLFGFDHWNCTLLYIIIRMLHFSLFEKKNQVNIFIQNRYFLIKQSNIVYLFFLKFRNVNN